jgi:hypothetical protein
MPATATSLWPVPIVSTSTVSKPAASHSSSASRVRAATPPSVVPPGDGRMNALECRLRSVIRVLSPRMLPPVTAELGSTASTATVRPAAHSRRPSASMSVLLPTPGAPVMPTRMAPPVCGSSSCSKASAAG